MNKKGLSDVVTTVLIILLVVAAVSIVWAFIVPTLKGTGGNIQKGQICLTNSVNVLSCMKVNASGRDAYNVAFRPVFGEDIRLNTAKVSLEYADGTFAEITLNGSMESGNAFSALILSSKNALRAKVSPAFLSKDGTSKICDFPSVACTTPANSSGGMTRSTGTGNTPGSTIPPSGGTPTPPAATTGTLTINQGENYVVYPFGGDPVISDTFIISNPLNEQIFLTLKDSSLSNDISWPEDVTGCDSFNLPSRTRCFVTLTVSSPNKVINLITIN